MVNERVQKNFSRVSSQIAAHSLDLSILRFGSMSRNFLMILLQFLQNISQGENDSIKSIVSYETSS